MQNSMQCWILSTLLHPICNLMILTWTYKDVEAIFCISLELPYAYINYTAGCIIEMVAWESLANISLQAMCMFIKTYRLANLHISILGWLLTIPSHQLQALFLSPRSRECHFSLLIKVQSAAKIAAHYDWLKGRDVLLFQTW